jgi:diguanylate cyclase (GGDEF)-like protein
MNSPRQSTPIAAPTPGRPASVYVEAAAVATPLTLPCGLLLHEAVEQYDLSAYPYYLVVDDSGMIVGVLSPEDIAARIGAWNDAERKRWADMPLESLLHTRLEPGHYPDCTESPPYWDVGTRVPCSIIGQQGKLLAVMTSDDLLISWRMAEATLRAATVDAVTQLPNRLVFHQRLQEEIIRARRISGSIGVILLDVDHFKTINDVFGHATGDLVLQTVGSVLHQTMRSYDHVARYGGDEFAVVCCGCRPGEIDLPIFRLQNAIRELAGGDSEVFRKIAVSIGVAVVHEAAMISKPEELVDAADQCLYRAKGHGRNCAFKMEAVHGRLSGQPIMHLAQPVGRPAASAATTRNAADPAPRS